MKRKDFIKNGGLSGNGANGRVFRKKDPTPPDGSTQSCELKHTPVLLKLALMKSLAAVAHFANRWTLVVLHRLRNLWAMMRAMIIRGFAPDGFKRPWLSLIKIDEPVKAKVERLFGSGQ